MVDDSKFTQRIFNKSLFSPQRTLGVLRHFKYGSSETASFPALTEGRALGHTPQHSRPAPQRVARNLSENLHFVLFHPLGSRSSQ